MNKTEDKKKMELIKENRNFILGVTTFFAALILLISLDSIGFYW
jgi:hypothetical protein